MSESFAGEAFLINPPPDYAAEWSAIVTRLVVNVVFFVIVVPIVLPIFFGVEQEIPTSTNTNASAGNNKGSEAAKSTSSSTKKTHRSKRRKPTQKDEPTPAAVATAPTSEKVTVVEAPPFLLPILNIICLVLCFVIIARSPNNYAAARAVYQAPLLTIEECEHIIDMAHKAAERNIQEAEKDGANMELLQDAGITRVDDDAGEFNQQHQQQQDTQERGRTLFDEPVGWRKDRHTSYPTTDLNLVTDAFTKDDRTYLENILDARLSPLLERVYGIAPGAVRANDMFVVRYDYDKGQKALRGHTDSSHVSFNVLLNEDFTGGGTRFHNRRDGTYTDAKPKRGEVLVNNALVFHEGLPVTSGTRYILVGFMSVDRVEPVTQEPTGLSLFASWLSLPWCQVQFKDAIYASYGRMENTSSEGVRSKWTDNKYVRNLFRDITYALQIIGDLWSPHTLTKLVDDGNASGYIKALDKEEADKKAKGRLYRRRASWFKNQQLHIDIDGSISDIWDSRKKAEDKFQEL